MSRIQAVCCLIVLLLNNSQNAFPRGRPEEKPDVVPSRGTYGLPLVRERVTLDYFIANHKTKPFTAEDLTIAEFQRRTNVYFNIISIDSGARD